MNYGGDKQPSAFHSIDRGIDFQHSYAKVNDDDGSGELNPAVNGHDDHDLRPVDRKKANVKHFHVVCSFILVGLIFFIMMWDMKKVQMMSTIIHDDHRSLWVRMNTTVFKYWYNSYDLCVLNNRVSIIHSNIDHLSSGMSNNNISSNANLVNTKQCNSVTSSIDIGSSKQMPLRCNVGYGFHALNCLTNMTARSFFRYTLNDRTLGDPRNLLLRSVLMDLSMMKRPIVILGDGLSKQSQDAMICEILRTDKSVKVTSKSSYYSSNYTLRWPNAKRQVDLYYFRLVTINTEDDSPHRKRQRRRRVLNQSIDDATMNSSQQAITDAIAINNSAQSIVDFTMNSSQSIGDAVMTHDSQLNITITASISSQPIIDTPTMNTSQSNEEESDLINSPQITGDESVLPNIVQSTDDQSMWSNSTVSIDELWANSTLQVVDERPLFSTQLPADNDAAVNDSVVYNSLDNVIESSNDTTIFNNTSAVDIGNSTDATNATTLSGEFPPSPPPTNQRVTSVHFTYVQSRIRTLVEQYHSLVVIVNVGVYYNSREQFRIDLPHLLDWMHSLHVDHNCTVFFRETAAQHWSHTSSGYFELDIDGQNSSISSCTPVADSTPEYDWRNRDVNNYISNEGYDNSIHVIPFRDLTLPLYNMHPSNGTHQDCTHYCYFPQMWQNMWYYLYSVRMR